MDFDVVLYESGAGGTPVKSELEQIRASNPILHARLMDGLGKLQSWVYHRPPLSKSLGEGFFELRVGRKDIARAVYVYLRSRRLLVLRVFVKKTQKIRKKDLEVARQRKDEYRMRYPSDL